MRMHTKRGDRTKARTSPQINIYVSMELEDLPHYVLNGSYTWNQGKNSSQIFCLVFIFFLALMCPILWGQNSCIHPLVLLAERNSAYSRCFRCVAHIDAIQICQPIAKEAKVFGVNWQTVACDSAGRSINRGLRGLVHHGWYQLWFSVASRLVDHSQICFSGYSFIKWVDF